MTKKAGFYLSVFIVVVYSASPFVWQAVTSFKHDTEIVNIPPLLPEHPTIMHYKSIFEKRAFARIILNSTVVAAVTTLFSVIIGSIAAFAFAKLRVSAKKVLLGLILSISMFPPISTITPLYIIIKTIGLRDTWRALIITYITFSLPMTIWILTNFFKEIPDELYYAARLDGCSVFQAFYKIILPLAAPGISAVSILLFIFSWNEFLFALTFTSTSASITIPVGIALFPGVHELPWGDIAAASVIVTFPLIILVFAFQKRIIEGLTSGAVKG